MLRITLVALACAALIFTAAASAKPGTSYLPTYPDPRYTGSCGVWNTWAAQWVGGALWLCYPDGWWHEQFAGHDFGRRAD